VKRQVIFSLPGGRVAFPRPRERERVAKGWVRVVG